MSTNNHRLYYSKYFYFILPVNLLFVTVGELVRYQSQNKIKLFCLQIVKYRHRIFENFYLCRDQIVEQT